MDTQQDWQQHGWAERSVEILRDNKGVFHALEIPLEDVALAIGTLNKLLAPGEQLVEHKKDKNCFTMIAIEG